MSIDRNALEAMQRGDEPILRLFQWTRPTITHGYLLDPARVREWAQSIVHSPSTIDLVKRPTGGGAVLHTPNDLSLSLLWPRSSKMFSEHPRECYEQIHSVILGVLTKRRKLNLYSKGLCAPQPKTAQVPVCFQEPVCNDIMQDGKKIVGGALRITKQAILYQGTIQYGQHGK